MAAIWAGREFHNWDVNGRNDLAWLTKFVLALIPLIYHLTEKRTYNSLPTLMTEVAREELKRLPDGIEECSVIYLPQVREDCRASGRASENNLCDFKDKFEG